MSVLFGAACIDENKKAKGGQPGDQTKGEVKSHKYYVHSKGWRVFRAIDPAKRHKIGEAMRKACENNLIGYDQSQRNTLYMIAKAVQFDVNRVYTPCETDCSALVRVCCGAAGILLEDFNTASEPSVLMESGAFMELTGGRYTNSSMLLEVGDILVTPSKGHTVIVIQSDREVRTVGIDMEVLREGSEGKQVKTAQRLLMAMGYDLPKYGADGDFGSETAKAVKAFQTDKDIKCDGVIGFDTWTNLLK